MVAVCRGRRVWPEGWRAGTGTRPHRSAGKRHWQAGGPCGSELPSTRWLTDTISGRVNRQGRSPSTTGVKRGAHEAAPTPFLPAASARRGAREAAAATAVRASDPHTRGDSSSLQPALLHVSAFSTTHTLFPGAGGESRSDVSPAVEGFFRACCARVILCSCWVSGRSGESTATREQDRAGDAGQVAAGAHRGRSTPAAQDAASRRGRGLGTASSAPGSCPQGGHQAEPAEGNGEVFRGNQRAGSRPSGASSRLQNAGRRPRHSSGT